MARHLPELVRQDPHSHGSRVYALLLSNYRKYQRYIFLYISISPLGSTYIEKEKEFTEKDKSGQQRCQDPTVGCEEVSLGHYSNLKLNRTRLHLVNGCYQVGVYTNILQNYDVNAS